jgi:hypothetical protein
MAPSRGWCTLLLARALPAPLVNQLVALALNIRAWAVVVFCRRHAQTGADCPVT